MNCLETNSPIPVPTVERVVKNASTQIRQLKR
jgi:hypothetical protein